MRKALAVPWVEIVQVVVLGTGLLQVIVLLVVVFEVVASCKYAKS
jgi:hypothetical protein